MKPNAVNTVAREVVGLEYGFAVSVGGWRSWLSADTSDGLEQFRSIYSPYLAVQAAEAGSPGIRVLLADRSRPEVQFYPWHQQGSPLRSLAAGGPEWERFAAIDPEAGTFADRILGPVPALAETERGFEVLEPSRWPLYAFLGWVWLALNRAPFVGVHAATLAIDGKAILLVGPSGSGKSTLCWALHQAGADYFGDEFSLLSLPDYCLYPFPRMLYLRPGGISALQISVPESSWREVKSGDPKCAVTIPLPQRSCPHNQVHVVMMSGFAREPQVERASAGEGVRRLLRGMAFGPQSVPERIDIIAGLSEKYPCWKLTAGPPHQTAAAVLRKVLEQP